MLCAATLSGGSCYARLSQMCGYALRRKSYVQRRECPAERGVPRDDCVCRKELREQSSCKGDHDLLMDWGDLRNTK